MNDLFAKYFERLEWADEDNEGMEQDYVAAGMKCKVCGVRIYLVREPHWHGWLDEDDDQLSYVPTLHCHKPDYVRDSLERKYRGQKIIGY